MTRQRLKIIYFFVLAALVLSLGLYHYYFTDVYDIIKPLPEDVPLIIRVDKYGSGHFGSSRGHYRHRGIDLAADQGTAVLACKSGWVVKTPYDKLSGNYVVLNHRRGLKSYYLHLDEVLVKKGQWVRQGDVVGTVGKTGNASYDDMITHLHFELRQDGLPVDILEVYELEPYEEQGFIERVFAR